MAKRIILLSDGTGNAAAKIWRSNVWRVFQALDLTTGDQVAAYDDGVGTSAFKPLALLGGAFGWGLKRNVLDLYKFVCRNWENDAEIYAFGFSRGAFTVRVLVGFVANQGLVNANSEAELHQKAKEAYRAYRSERYHSVLGIERLFRSTRAALGGFKNFVKPSKPYNQSENRKVDSIRFIGLWDTVAAYGLPVEEMTHGVSQWLWPLGLPDRILGEKVKRACHALSLDDERTTFHPVLWTESEETTPTRPDGKKCVQDERLSQVWFAGVHANVGGGYPDDSLAHVPLYWMMNEAHLCGLRFKAKPDSEPDAVVQARSARDKDGRLYDPRQGLGGYYRYGPRKIHDLANTRLSAHSKDVVEIALPKIHASVFGRIGNGAHAYAPLGLPARYAVVTEEGELLDGAFRDGPETGLQAERRAAAQEHAWNLVWARRVFYFLTLAASLHLALYPLFHKTDPAAEFSSPVRPASEVVRLVDAFTPGFFNLWMDAYAASPGKLLLNVIAVGVLIYVGSRLHARITDVMLAVWHPSPSRPLPALPTDWLFRLRTNRCYRAFIKVIKWRILPFFSVVAILYVCFTFLSHLIFNIEDAAGSFCKETQNPTPVSWKATVPSTTPYRVSDICWASGITLEESELYVVTIIQTTPWKDGAFPVEVNGYEITELPSLLQRVRSRLLIPLRRVFLRPWFRVIGRMGAIGTDEYFFDPGRPSVLRKSRSDQLEIRFRPRRRGELFLYVNEAVLALPWIYDIWYRNNSGEAQVTVRHAPR